ncbi:MAG: hypothetical protein A2172_02670 [Candidatus Woykebacteria bacterium RBG_13_40_15]|uniref:ComEC/Rec2-related protein domain-containing protein n=1 Tax=Candidatus Woykebacteria bacterium RBG_13_40_15 TaxID=1802593 RepID=A0A1G1W6K0_9BACT|nr:MAG: hypothetical protein A2172_02670 [Candidatus Woykebacteria bacterium RBG_13_40_15]
MKTSKTKSPQSSSWKKFTTLIILITTTSLLCIRFATFLEKPKEGFVEFKATLLEEPKIFRNWQYFDIDGYILQTVSDPTFEYGDILKIKGQLVGGKLSSPLIEKVGESTWQRKLYFFRQKLNDKITATLPQPESALLAGIVLGEKENLPADLKDSLVRSGTIHVVVVSGYNISVVSGFLIGLAGFVHRRVAIILGLVGIAFYTFLVGADPPAVRAAIMGGLAFFAAFFGRQTFTFYALILAGSLMFILEPAVLSNIGFQLSFLATAGIVVFQKRVLSIFRLLPKPLNDDLSTTVSAQLLVAPVIFYHFGSVSAISPAANAAVLWIIPIATILGFIFLLAAFIFMPIATIIGWIIWALLFTFISLVNIFSKLPISYFTFKPSNILVLVFYYLCVLVIFLYLIYGRLAKSK